jgi:peptide/nickel transport system substrate-binding protein
MCSKPTSNGNQTSDTPFAVNRRKLVGGASAFGVAMLAGAAMPGISQVSAAGANRANGRAAAFQAAPTNYKTWTKSAYEAETGETLPDYTEAPSLADRVASGELPALADRLPDDPLVVSPISEIGTYCGPVTGWGVNPTSFGNDVVSSRLQFPITVYPDYATFAPQILEAYELAEDSKSIVLHLRKGMKWSDGEPVTAADILYWYEDVLLNEELTPAISNDYKPGGEVLKLTQTDDFTVTLEFAAPHPIIIELLTSRMIIQPRHYLEQWHKKYTPEVETTAKDEGFDTWVLMYQAKSASGDNQENAGLPVLDPWAFSRSDEFGNKYYDRNPYYWKVDTQGQQLPYAEQQIRRLTGNLETTILQVRNGEIDFGAEQLQLKDIAVLREGQEAGGYRALLWQGVTGAERRYQFNLTIEDPGLNEIFNDVRFRQAMSLAINRDEINETLFFGQATPRQFTVPPTVSLYEDWMGEHYAQYDVDQANQLLDDMGLEVGGDGIRLRSDGQPISFAIEDAQFNEAMDELIVDYWRAVGIDTQIKSLTRELYAERTQANETQSSEWSGDIVDEINIRIRPVSFRPPWGIDNVPHSGSLWHQWYLSDGAEGVEPPEAIKELYTLAEQFQAAQRGTPEFDESGKALLTKNLEGLYVIGTVGLAPSVVIAGNTLRNFPEESIMMIKMQAVHGDQWYLAE